MRLIYVTLRISFILHLLVICSFRLIESHGVQLPETHRGRHYGWEFVMSMNVVENKILEELRTAKYYCFAVDESTDITMTKHLATYANYRVGVSIVTIVYSYI